jgi:penicillin-binding protein 2
LISRLMIGTENAVTREINYTPPGVLEPVADQEPEHWQIVHDAMVGVTTEPSGTARTPMAGMSYRVAAKTGTAQVVNIAQDERYREDELDERQRDHRLFVAFAPADAPRIAVGIVVENGGEESSAAPVARKVFDAYFATEGYVAREP